MDVRVHCSRTTISEKMTTKERGHCLSTVCLSIESVALYRFILVLFSASLFRDELQLCFPPPSSRRPLILSIHGSPGIGKSYSHWLLARSLYNVGPSGKCPGDDCPAYKVKLLLLQWAGCSTSGCCCCCCLFVCGHRSYQNFQVRK